MIMKDEFYNSSFNERKIALLALFCCVLGNLMCSYWHIGMNFTHRVSLLTPTLQIWQLVEFSKVSMHFLIPDLSLHKNGWVDVQGRSFHFPSSDFNTTQSRLLPSSSSASLAQFVYIPRLPSVQFQVPDIPLSLYPIHIFSWKLSWRYLFSYGFKTLNRLLLIRLHSASASSNTVFKFMNL